MSGRFWIGAIVGFVAGVLYANRQSLSDLWNNRRAVSAGERVVGGAVGAVGGLRDLWQTVQR